MSAASVYPGIEVNARGVGAAEGMAKAARRSRAAEAAREKRATADTKRAKKSARDGRPWPEMATTVVARVYREDVVVKVKVPRRTRRRDSSTVRGEVKGFTFDSARRLRFLLRNTKKMWDVFLTLTYPGAYSLDGREGGVAELDGRVVKRHVNAFCQFLRRRRIAYCWVLEFQERGAPHFHFLLSGFIPKADVAAAWYGIVGSGDERHLEAGTRIEGVKNRDQIGAYMDGYVSKMDQKAVPDGYKNVGRFWGASRCLSAVVYHAETIYRDASRLLRPLRAGQKAATRGFAQARRDNGKGFYKWRWRGFGFTLVGGASIMKTLLAQALLIDGPWKEGDPERAALKYVPLALRGQLMLDGTLDPGWAPDFDAEVY